MQARYPTLGALNAAWARRFTDWAQVAPPRLFEAVRQHGAPCDVGRPPNLV